MKKLVKTKHKFSGSESILINLFKMDSFNEWIVI